jgi:hypothetical protein
MAGEDRDANATGASRAAEAPGDAKAPARADAMPDAGSAALAAFASPTAAPADAAPADAAPPDAAPIVAQIGTLAAPAPRRIAEAAPPRRDGGRLRGEAFWLPGGGDAPAAGALAAADGALWIAPATGAALQRFAVDPAGDMPQKIDRFELARLVRGFARAADAGLAGLAYDPGDGPKPKRHLWIAGSHARQRCGDEHERRHRGEARGLARVLPRPDWELLARLRLDAAGAPAGRAAHFALGAISRKDPAALRHPPAARPRGLREALAEDPLLKPFLDIPPGENGFAVAGVAAKGDLVTLGLAGPVIGGQAVALQFRAGGWLGLKLGRVRRRDKLRYRKYLFDFDGLGIRSLARHGADVLILCGPPGHLGGPWYVVRWRDAFARPAEGAVKDGVEFLLQLPMRREARRAGESRVTAEPMPPLASTEDPGWSVDHPAALAAIPHPDKGDGLLVAYANPAADRQDGSRRKADVFYGLL